jgi:hypothetical protein
VRPPLLAGLGALGLFFRLTVPMLPLVRGYSLNQATRICSSSIGQFAQALDQQSAARCGQVALYMDGLNLAAVAGVLLLVAAGVLLLARGMGVSIVRK